MSQVTQGTVAQPGESSYEKIDHKQSRKECISGHKICSHCKNHTQGSSPDPILIHEYVSPKPAIDHNQYVLGSHLYQAQYASGLRILDIGGIIGLVACQQGLSTRGRAEEVGRATTTTVVRSIVLIIAADLFVTALLYLGD